MPLEQNQASEKSTPRPFFIIGLGRSGTHWLAHTLEHHPEIRATIESSPMFGWSTTMAVNPALEGSLLPRLTSEYEQQIRRSAPKHYLDKSHPNIWIAGQLKEAFPAALFAGIQRNPYSTVASMLKHEGVSGWHKRWREFPVPNRFLGIDSETAKSYEVMSLCAQCALRWLVHHDELNDLKKTLGNDILVINYESLAKDTGLEVRRLQEFLGLVEPIAVPAVRSESLDKWKNQLSVEEIQQISEITGISPENATSSETS